VIASRSLTSSGLARWAFALLAVPAILVGILAMHFLAGLPNGGGQAHAMSASAPAVAEHMSTEAVPPVSDSCSAQCGPAHEMTAMACLLLALLVAAVLLAGAMGSTGALSPRMLLARVGAATGGLAPPRPPSLLVLSISRT
jgi:hypothetical protein